MSVAGPKLTLLICSRFSAYLILPRREFGILSRVFHRISKRQRTVSELCLVLGRLKGLTMLDAAHIQRDSLQVESAVGVLLVDVHHANNAVGVSGRQVLMAYLVGGVVL